MNYVALQVKTSYSLLESLNDIKKLVSKAKDLGYTSLAITDHNNMFGVMEFYLECKKMGIKPIIGVSLDINDSSILLYAKNHDGYKNLIRLTTIVSDRNLTIDDLTYYKDNLVAIIDNNGLSSHDPVNEVINLGSLEDKFKAFNWDVVYVKDGNNMAEVVEALDKMEKLSGKPIAIIMKTVKGKGISFLENNPNCHSVTINDKDYEQVKKDLDM